jgi:large subunit ribosomal protein L3
MPSRKSPRKGSLQFWPRKRVSKFLPRVNWGAISSGKNIQGFICYKAGMMSAIVKDNTTDSMTKDKKIVVPVTVLECPPMRIFSVRFYKNNKVAKDVLAENLEKELKKKVKLPKKAGKKLDDLKIEDYDDVSVIVYSQVKKTNVKKTPDMTELGLTGSKEEKLAYIKENLTKEILVFDLFEAGQLVDLRGLTKGKGNQGPVKRFGITLKASKSEKGQRRPGSIGPWHPARVIFRVPMAGQLGLFTRQIYNNKILEIGKEKLKAIKNYGDIKTDYIVVRGSVMGPAKRQLLITAPLRESKKQLKKQFELVALK